MIEFAKFKDCEYLEVTTIEDKKFTGRLLCILDKSEFYDLDEEELQAVYNGEKEYDGDAEDELTLVLQDGKLLGFNPSKVKSIINLSEHAATKEAV